MRTDVIKRLARLWPSLLLALLAFFLFHAARKLNGSVQSQISQVLNQNSIVFQQQIDKKRELARKSFEALTKSVDFETAWDKKDAIGLLHEINSITRFLEQIGSADRVMLLDEQNKSVVDMSASASRLPDALAEVTSNADNLYLTNGGDLFLLTAIPFHSANASGTLKVWQLITPDKTPGFLAALDRLIAKDSSVVDATLINQPTSVSSDNWKVTFERRMLGKLPYLALEQNHRLFVGNPLNQLTLYPSGQQSGIIRASDATSLIGPLKTAKKQCGLFGSIAAVLSLITGFLLTKKCRACDMHQQEAESRKLELEMLLAEREAIRSEKGELERKLTLALADQLKLEEFKARIRELEASEAELEALSDTLQAELDEQPEMKASAELDRAYTTISELKGLLEQCNTALAASHQELNESLSTNQRLKQQLDSARKDVTRQEELMINQHAGNTVMEEEIELLKKQNEALEARVMGLQQAYMTTLEEFQTYREEFELQQATKKPTGPMPPQMEFNLGVTKPTRPQKEIELPPIVNRLQERLVARKSSAAVFNLRKVCEKAIASQERDAHHHGLELALHLIPGTPEELAGDPIALELLLSNLLRFNSLATSDGFVSIEATVEVADNKDGALTVSFLNNGCSRSLHPWTDWVANPYQADCHENEIAAEWCAQLIDRLGGRFEVGDALPNIECKFILPVRVVRTSVVESGPFNGEKTAIFYGNTKRDQIITEQLKEWGLAVESINSASEISPAARVLIIDESLRQSEELRAVAEGNPELPILLGDINRSERFLKQLKTALGYESSPIEQTDLFG